MVHEVFRDFVAGGSRGELVVVEVVAVVDGVSALRGRIDELLALVGLAIGLAVLFS